MMVPGQGANTAEMGGVSHLAPGTEIEQQQRYELNSPEIYRGEQKGFSITSG
jgi:hypothetical protein